MAIKKDEYIKALKIVREYETILSDREARKIDKMKKDIDDLFRTHKIDGREIHDYRLEKHWLSGYEIVFTDPYFDEDYSGEDDTIIENIGLKYKFRLKVSSEHYSK